MVIKSNMTSQSFPHYDLSSLTYRELELIRLASLGYSNLRMAEEMRLGFGTIKYIKARLFVKYDVPNITPLCVNAALQGLLTC